MSDGQHNDPLGFPDTGWSTILQARNAGGDSVPDALYRLCERYEPAIRRSFQRFAPDSSVNDLVQGFFAERFLRPQFLSGIERDGGRFRDFLRVCLRNYCRTHWRTVLAENRRVVYGPPGSGSMEETPAQDPTPDECVDREWALHLLELACERLRKEAEEARLTGVYDQFRAQLEDPAHAPSHAETASRLGKSTGAISVGVHRMRARFAWLVHDEIRQTVADPTRWREERDHLMAILRVHRLQ